MTDLDRKALLQTPLTSVTGSPALLALCRSHERLRMEVEGLQALMEQQDDGYKRVIDEVKQAVWLLDNVAEAERKSGIIDKSVSVIADRLRALLPTPPAKED